MICFDRCLVLCALSDLCVEDLIRSCFNTESTEDAEQRKNHSGKQFNHGWRGWARMRAKAEGLKRESFGVWHGESRKPACLGASNGYPKKHGLPEDHHGRTWKAVRQTVASGTACDGLRCSDYLAAGMTHEQIVKEFRYLTEEDIRACLAYAADRERWYRLP